jgi:hypothetical protein
MGTCENCKYYVSATWVSTCRRYPTYVERKPTDWCGQYEKLEKPVEPEEEPKAKPKGRPKKNVGNV